MSNKTGPCRALIAYGMCGNPVLLATDNTALVEYATAIRSDGGEDLGLVAYDDHAAGLYLFEGEGAWYADGEGDADLEWDGTLRTIRAEELPALLAMKPPETP